MASAVPLAIIGYGCRLPGGVDDGPSFWKLLAEGRDAVREIPPDRWNTRAMYREKPGLAGKTNSKWAGLLDQIDQFEPECFGISPREAAFIDPQQRLLLETTWEALEHAGVAVDSLAGSRTGVFVGICLPEYGHLQTVPPDLRGLNAFTGQGTSLGIAANRISYWLDLHGPSFIVDTACSSSLVALDRAVKSLRQNESDCAIVGGVNIIISPALFVSFSQASMLSPEGRCKSFDASAHGFVRAEGAGVVLLKRLDDALAAGDRIHAVVLETGINQDGRTSGMAMPNGAAQETLVREVYAAAGIAPEDVAYVEAHGTGTAIGDPTEAGALGRALGNSRRDRPLILGSVKTNIGHLEGGAGMASVLKAVLMIEHRQIPPNLHFTTPNPHIDFEALRIRVPVTLESWPDDRPALIGINSFGFGGTNAHAIIGEHRSAASRAVVSAEVEAAPAAARTVVVAEAAPAAARAVPVIITSRNADALRALAQSWLSFLEGAERAGTALADIAAVATRRRTHCAHVLGFAAATFAEARDAIAAFCAGESRPGMQCAERPRQAPQIAFAFSGQGPQWYGMGRELYASEPVFRASMDDCDVLFRPVGGWSIVEEIHKEEAASRVHHTAVAQAALFALHVALARLWRSWGIAPVAVLGHSVGEIAAAHVAGALSLETAVRLVARRGRCLEDHALPGRMLAVTMAPADARECLERFGGRIGISAVNAPDMLTLGGDAEAIEQLASELAAGGTWCRLLEVGHAFHTARVEPARDAFLDGLKVDNAKLACPMISTVRGEPVADGTLGADYWWDNIREPVRFADAIRQARERGITAFVEIGPHPVLSAAIRQCRMADRSAASVWPSLSRGNDETRTMLSSLLGLFAAGAKIAWPGAACAHPGIELPRHPWTRQRYWNECETSLRLRTAADHHPLLGARAAGPERRWQALIDPADLAWIKDHRVGGRTIFPGAAFMEMALAAAMRSLGSDACVLDDLHIDRPLAFQDGAIALVHTTIDRTTSELRIASRAAESEDAWVQHVETVFRAASAGVAVPALDPASWQASAQGTGPGHLAYDFFRTCGLDYGPAFQGLVEVSRREPCALARIHLPDAAGSDEPFAVHPALLDACFQLVLAAMPWDEANAGVLYLPVRMDRIALYRRPGRRAWCEVRLLTVSRAAVVADIRIHDEAGELALEITGAHCIGVARPVDRGRQPMTACFYRTAWHHQALPTGSSAQANARPPFVLRERLQRITDEADRRVAMIWHDQTDQRAEATLADTDAVAAAYAKHALREIAGPVRRGAMSIDTQKLARSGRITEHSRPQIEHCLASLVHAGLATEAGAHRWRVPITREDGEAEARWRRALAAHPQEYPWLRLIQICGTRAAQVWSGKADALEVLFSREGADLLEQIYRDHEWSRYANALIAQVIAGAIARCREDRPLRILEVGAGTGGTTSAILPLLPPERTEYWFTDTSQFFLTRAQEKLHAFAFVQYRRLDLELPFEEQDIAPGSFDVIIAADVLHAVHDVGKALARCRGALADGGLLIARELLRPRITLDLVFGSTDGWWNWRGDPARPAGPLLNLAEWSRLLQRHGFDGPAVPPLCQKPGLFAGVFIARAHGGQTRGAGIAPVLPAEALPPERDWLVLGEANPVSQRVMAWLRARGLRCVAAASGEEQISDVRRELGDTYGVIDLRSLSASLEDTPTACCARIVRALHALHAVAPPRRFLLALDASRTLDTAALGGIGRTAAREFSGTGTRMITVDLSDRFCAEQLCAEIMGDAPDEEVAWRGGFRYVPRLQTAADVVARRIAARSTMGFALAGGRSNDLDGLHLRQVQRRRPRNGEVEVEVHFGALNFRDVLKALGRIASDDPRQLELGDECAGVVRRIGRGVTHVSVGDLVVVCHTGTLRSHVTVPAQCVLPIPPGLDMQSAVSMPIAFMTADYALREVAKLAPGETVLIHAAAGGVGLAAMQIARRIGARVFATAGSPMKRELVRRLGAERAMDSRSLAFFDEVMEATSGRGVDVVLNSLAGQAMARGLACLAPRGRFLELGKRDFAENTHVGLWALRRNVSYHAIDLSVLLAPDASRLAGRAKDAKAAGPAALDSLRELLAAAGAGELSPLPVRIMPVGRAADAFRLMAQGGHIGKIVLDMAQPGARAIADERVKLRADATYLVTGGFSGIGLVLAQWLADRGARNLALASRRGPHDEPAHDALARLRRLGVDVRALICDVADAAGVGALLEVIDRDMPPLRGVFHLANVIDDGLIVNLDAARIARSMDPKLEGAWNLHLGTKHRKLDHFVLFSSVSASFPNFGQASYAAANAAMEQLALDRRAAGLPGRAIAWGTLGEAGYVAERPELLEALTQLGLIALSTADIRAALDTALTSEDAVLVSARIDWRRVARRFPVRSNRGEFLLSSAAENLAGDATTSALDAIKAAALVERPALIADYVRKTVGRVLGMAPAKIGTDRPLAEMGLDSLMGVELAGQIEADLGVTFALAAVGRDISIARITDALIPQLGGTALAAAPAAAATAPEPATANDIGSCVVQLSGDEDKPPLFCFHPSGGDVDVYGALAKALSNRYRVVGIRSRLLAGAKDEFGSLDEMAMAYAELVQREDPTGPHHLFGFSFGGVLALRTARILLDRGNRVAWVGIAEADVRWMVQQDLVETSTAFLLELFEQARRESHLLDDLAMDVVRKEARALAEALVSRAGTTQARNRNDGMRSMLMQWLSAPGRLSKEAARSLVDGPLARIVTHVLLLADAQPCPAIDVPLHVWTASDGLNRDGDAWHTLTQGSVQVRTIPGRHFDVMAPPQSQLIAAQLAALDAPETVS